MLAHISALSAGWQALLFGVAFILFAASALLPLRNTPRGGVNLIAAGLALCAFVWAWAALALA